MAALDERMISAMQEIMQSRRDLIADYQACDLSDDDRTAFDEITRGAGRWL